MSAGDSKVQPDLPGGAAVDFCHRDPQRNLLFSRHRQHIDDSKFRFRRL